MNRPMSADSNYEEPSEEEVLEADLLRLKRSYTSLENEYKLFKEETRRKLLKQRGLMKVLEDERCELDTGLDILKSKTNTDRDTLNAFKLQELSKLEKQIIEEIEQERTKIQELQEDMMVVEGQLKEKMMTSTVNKGPERSKEINKKLRVLKGRLMQANVRFNGTLMQNQKLRDDIYSLRVEKGIYDNIYSKVSDKLVSVKHDVNQIIDETTQAFELRDEATNKMRALHERNEKDKASHALECADLHRLIDHDEKVKVFMALKNDERAKLKAEEAAKKKVTGEEQRKNADKRQIQAFEEAFQKLKEVVGGEDVDLIIETFVKKEEQNFALFNYVNELNADVEKLQDEIKTMHEDIAKTKTEEETQDSGRSTLIKHLERKCESVNAETQQAETELTKINQTLDELKSALEKIFKLLECNARPIRQLLGGDTGISNENVMVYMGMIEHRATQLCNLLLYGQLRHKIRHRIHSEEDRTTKLQIPHDYFSHVEAPAILDDEDADGDGDTDFRPLNATELRTRALKTMHKRQQQQNLPQASHALLPKASFAKGGKSKSRGGNK